MGVFVILSARSQPKSLVQFLEMSQIANLPSAYLDRYRVRRGCIVREGTCGNWTCGCCRFGFISACVTSSAPASFAPPAILSSTFFIPSTLCLWFSFLWRFRRFWHDKYGLVIKPSNSFNGADAQIELADLLFSWRGVVLRFNLIGNVS